MEKRIIRYGKLSKPLKDELKRQYPFGYDEHMIEVKKTETSEKMNVIPLELEDKYYLVVVKKQKKIKRKLVSPSYKNEEMNEFGLTSDFGIVNANYSHTEQSF